MTHNKLVDHSAVTLTNGFWRQKQEMVRDVSIGAVYDRFRDTLRFEALKCRRDPAHPELPHIFFDSDTAKWIESAAYVLQYAPDAALEAKCDGLISDMAANQLPDGYFQSHFITLEPEARWTRQSDHELYCAGHLMEAAVAYYRATGKDTLLGMVRRMADHIERVFVTEKTAKFPCPGHEEIELALVRLWECTGEARYLRLAEHFLDVRGVEPNASYEWCFDSYFQAHKPVREQDTAEGHAVRAVYLYNGMARVADASDDEGLRAACRKLFDNIVTRRMYVTGGIGSSAVGEAFTVDYDLPNLKAYTESCAALGLALFANQMLRVDADARYADVVERAMYNGFLSSVSLDGRRFFYENPLEIDPALHTKDASVSAGQERFPPMQRVEVFDCSCCPPNITRFIASIADLQYSHDDGTVYVNQYMAGTASFDVGGAPVRVTQTTNYPYEGGVTLAVSGAQRLALRIPGWCRRWTLTVNGEAVSPALANGYAAVELTGDAVLALSLELRTELIAANPKVQHDAGRVAVQRGPLVYCLEEPDNGKYLRDVRVRRYCDFTPGWDDALGVGTLETVGLRRRLDGAPLYAPAADDLVAAPLRFIPYFAFANRGPAEMIVWVLLA